MPEHLVMGILAHVDAGKTTLSEALLYTAGAIRNLGRVDKKDAFLDTYALERERGITIFSKQAEFQVFGRDITLLDTPGHVDFSAEMERVLVVLDVAVLVVSGSAGIQDHTRTLWKLLDRYQVPTFLFVNKMDQPGTDAAQLLAELKDSFGPSVVNFSDPDPEHLTEEIAVCDEELMEQLLGGEITSFDDLDAETITHLVQTRKLFPCFFGSALRLTGIEEFLKAFAAYAPGLTDGGSGQGKDGDNGGEQGKAGGGEQGQAGAGFAARVFKIAREDGVRLTYLKVTAGTLAARDVIDGEKINQIRIYSGEKYETREAVTAGEVAAVTGLTKTFAGQGLGALAGEQAFPLLEPVMQYQILLPEGVQDAVMLPKLRELEEEIPELHIVYEPQKKEILAKLMGEVQLEILTSLIHDRFGIRVKFGPGSILYKETIADTVEGVGHFEPLRHYAEVHLLLRPGEPGSGLVFDTECSEDVLDKNWQRLVLTHLAEKEHKGILIGAPITDMRITLVNGRAHIKHTEGGDFRQATYRAVRHGLRQATAVLLEPVYDFVLEVPDENIGRAMNDIEQMAGHFEAPEQENGRSILKGKVPVSEVKDYEMQLRAYSRGEGRLTLTLSGYERCHNAEEVVYASGYDPDFDVENTADSVFCSHGAGFIVPWYEVANYMHLPAVVSDMVDGWGLSEEEDWMEAAEARVAEARRRVDEAHEISLGTTEIDQILHQATNANRKNKDGLTDGERKRRHWNGRERTVVRAAGSGQSSQNSSAESSATEDQDRVGNRSKKRPVVMREDYLLVDGYNVIFGWDELREISETNIDAARDRLMDILSNYQGYKGCHLILVFDAYKVSGGQGSIFKYHNITVVYTREAETADEYIAKTSQGLRGKGNITVATSDGLVQMIIFGDGAARMSARELKEEVESVETRIREDDAVKAETKPLSFKPEVKVELKGEEEG